MSLSNHPVKTIPYQSGSPDCTGSPSLSCPSSGPSSNTFGRSSGLCLDTQPGKTHQTRSFHCPIDHPFELPKTLKRELDKRIASVRVPYGPRSRKNGVVGHQRRGGWSDIHSASSKEAWGHSKLFLPEHFALAAQPGRESIARDKQ